MPSAIDQAVDGHLGLGGGDGAEAVEGAQVEQSGEAGERELQHLGAG